MVHALQRAGLRLRPGGGLISIRPHPTWRPLVSILTGKRRSPVARLINPGFDRYLRATEAALQRVVDEGWFGNARRRSREYRSCLDNLSELRPYLVLIIPLRKRCPPGA